MAAAISPWAYILLLCLQNCFAQQCTHNFGHNTATGALQQTLSKTTGPSPQNTGFNYNVPQTANIAQISFRPTSNTQQAGQQQQMGISQSQLNSQQVNSQEPVNLMTNLQYPQNQNQISNIFPALRSLKQSAQTLSQGTNSYGLKQIEPQSQNQPTPTFTMSIPTVNKAQPEPVSNTFTEEPKPAFTYKFIPVTPQYNTPSQQYFQQNQTPVEQSSYIDQNQMITQYPQSFFTQNQPTYSTEAIQQGNTGQIQSPQTTSPLSQPVAFTLQNYQTPLAQNQQMMSGKTVPNQPIFSMQAQPAGQMQNQKIQSSQLNNIPMDDQSLISFIMSQMQSPQGNGYPLASILPALMNTKSEKSSIKSLLPLIFNLLSDDNPGCVCPHCGCGNNKNQNKKKPAICTGYSKQKNYGMQEIPDIISAKAPVEIENKVSPLDVRDRKKYSKNVISNISAETLEEDNESEEEEEDE